MHNIGAISSAAILSILAGTRSGPEALAGLGLLSIFSIHGSVNVMSDIDVTGCPSIPGKGPLGSLVNWEVYWAFHMNKIYPRKCIFLHM